MRCLFKKSLGLYTPRSKLFFELFRKLFGRDEFVRYCVCVIKTNKKENKKKQKSPKLFSDIITFEFSILSLYTFINNARVNISKMVFDVRDGCLFT